MATTSYDPYDDGSNASLWRREPAIIIGAAEAVLALLVGFGLDITGEQMALIGAALASVMAVVTRSQVFSPASVAALKSRLRARRNPAGAPGHVIESDETGTPFPKQLYGNDGEHHRY